MFLWIATDYPIQTQRWAGQTLGAVCGFHSRSSRLALPSLADIHAGGKAIKLTGFF